MAVCLLSEVVVAVAVCCQMLKMELDDQQPSIEAVHEAGRAVIKSEGGAEAKKTREKLDTLHHNLELVRTKIRDRQLVLDDWLKDVCHLMTACVPNMTVSRCSA